MIGVLGDLLCVNLDCCCSTIVLDRVMDPYLVGFSVSRYILCRQKLFLLFDRLTCMHFKDGAMALRWGGTEALIAGDIGIAGVGFGR